MPHWPEIKKQAAAFGLDPLLLAGLVAQESSGNPWAVRAEPQFKWIPEDYAEERPKGCSSTSELWGRKTSWGLCQIMGQVARERGFSGWFPELCQPAVNLHYGAKHLAGCLKRREHDYSAALLRYNGGGNPRYAQEVLTKAQDLDRAGLK